MQSGDCDHTVAPAAGGTVAAITLSWGGPATYPHRYTAGKRQFEQAFGCRVIETRHALRDAAWIAANPQARADDLMGAFAEELERSMKARTETPRFPLHCSTRAFSIEGSICQTGALDRLSCGRSP